MASSLNYLALGDSYTIGEGVTITGTFPYQTTQLLRRAGLSVTGPEIIAKTGWTTAELLAYLDTLLLESSYDLVSLLIGVNNQYRGLPVVDYINEFGQLLSKCVELAGKPQNVFVLSVPDWSLTPSAAGRDTGRISREISEYNRINTEVTRKIQANYIDITAASPESANDLSFLADDGLHPSAKAYARWAQLLSSNILQLTIKDR